MDLNDRRRFFAEEIEAIGGVKSAALVEAFASIPRERFLRPGPWVMASEWTLGQGARPTPDADPRHVYHNCGIGIDPTRQLFNGTPSLLAGSIDALGLPGARVLHIGAGLGYYTAVMGHVVWETGRVLGIEVDETLAAEAAGNLSAMPWVEVRCGNGTGLAGQEFDAILVNAGMTHPRAEWLDALRPNGRMVLPLTATMPAMGGTGKGIMISVAKKSRADFDARSLTFIAIYSAIGLRDDAINQKLGQALMRTPFPPLKHLRCDSHAPGSGCWLHADDFCFMFD